MRLRKVLKEAATRDNPVQDFADLVGKGGKYENRAVAQFLQKRFNVKRDIEEPKVQDIIDSLEDWNYHTEMSMLEALVKGKKKEVDIYIKIAEEHAKLGHMPSDLSSLRYYLGNPKAFMSSATGHLKDYYADMPIRKDTVSLVKKMLSKKQADEFLSVFTKFV